MRKKSSIKNKTAAAPPKFHQSLSSPAIVTLDVGQTVSPLSPYAALPSRHYGI
jgi:hypothetical protein